MNATNPGRADAFLADAVEAAAFVDIFAAAPALLARQLGLSVRMIAGATALAARAVPDPILNRTIGWGVERVAREGDLALLRAHYRAAGVANWWLHLCPQARPPQASRWLEDHGFVPARRRAWAKMLRGIEPIEVVNANLAVRAATPADLPSLAATICAAYGMPEAFAPWFEALACRERWQAFAAIDDGVAVGAGLLYLDPASEAAWLGLGALRATHRGRGAHRALMALRINAALDAGAKSIVTETGEPIADEPNPSLRNMQRCGFRKVASRLNYTAPSA